MNNKPTDSELSVLALLWENGPQTVREIHDKIAESKPIGYTTTLKIMQIMLEKGLLSRKKQGKTHLYKPTFSKKSTQANMIDKMVSTVFNGSASDLVIQALGHGKTSKEELKEIRDYLNKLNNDE